MPCKKRFVEKGLHGFAGALSVDQLACARADGEKSPRQSRVARCGDFAARHPKGTGMDASGSVRAWMSGPFGELR